ncbi:MAG TPA: GIY-YIG nuclease family protein [Opitutales bacterium]|nr:GIY-YIG nuclease family protein [Opitutales bacterium]
MPAPRKQKSRTLTVLYYAYLLRCADGSLYAGCTKDLVLRLREHNHSPRGARYTRSRRPVELVYAESFAALRPARRREAAFKALPRAQKLALIQSIRHRPKKSARRQPSPS